MIDSMTLKLKESFDNSKLSIRKLSKLSGTPYASCHGIIRGGKNLTVSTFAKLAETLKLELTEVPDNDG